MSFPEIIGLLGILIAFFVVIFFTYKGFHLAYVVMVACIIVLVTEQHAPHGELQPDHHAQSGRTGGHPIAPVPVRRYLRQDVH